VQEAVLADDSTPTEDESVSTIAAEPDGAGVKPAEVTPSIGEAPAEIDEIVTVPSQDEADETKKDDMPGEVPPVVPEPKG
jgi:uncharacterized phage protein gp47/JayE